jgi:glutamate dehydrogenase
MGGNSAITSKIAAVCKLVGGKKPLGDREDLERFIKAFYKTAAPEDIEKSSEDVLYAAAYSLWRLAQKRKPGSTSVRVFNPGKKRDLWESRRTMVQVINEDMPFLVDSLTGELTVTRHMGIHTLHHPLMLMDRTKGGQLKKTIGSISYDEITAGQVGRESFIFIEIDRISDVEDRRELERAIKAVYADVHAAVEDWRPIMGKVEETIQSLQNCPPPVESDITSEVCAFLDWMRQDNFTFIGYREYMFEGKLLKENFKPVQGSGLGILRKPGRQILRGPKGLAAISNEVMDFLEQPDPIIITKANVKTLVHRPVHMDYVGVKIFNKRGRVIGERRFSGLFTSLSYSKRAEDIPLIRRKVANVMDMADYSASSHAGKALAHVLETFPRDELFQMDEQSLADMCFGIVHLLERPRPKIFYRMDKFERFVSVLAFVPRENYNSTIRESIANIIAEAFNGEISVYYTQLSDLNLARWHYIIRTKPGQVPMPDYDQLNALVVAAAKPWGQHMREELTRRFGEFHGKDVYERYQNVFPASYRDAFTPSQAVDEIGFLDQIKTPDDVLFDVYRLPSDKKKGMRLKIIHASRMVPLTVCLPRLENLGLKVISEHAYRIRTEYGTCIHDFYMKSDNGEDIDVDAVELLVEEILGELWYETIENDRLNALCLKSGMPYNKIVILRAYGKYLQQIGINLSQEYLHRCMVKHDGVSMLLVELFEVLFNPRGGSKKARTEKAKAIKTRINRQLERVTSIDEDRILRSYLNVIASTLRTNYFQASYAKSVGVNGIMPGLAMKIRSGDVNIMPKPRPFVEITVYSPRFEGIHLRGGPVARGGLRWSDRPEDFRTEILGLVKAQMVKNAVIVPIGAKGGFVPKHLDQASNREEFIAEGTACYKSFITSLLTVTDNLKAGKIVPPDNVVRWDGGDPYLVVAADKGTATFSDTANAIAIGFDFWLGDAFASGGSIGYDHKKMGITARGAWISVERHFREIGVNIAKDPVSVIGIGDMSGDVFGNGMLLSKELRVNVAFDHRHIFFDPNPDGPKSHAERKRLFKLPRSSWDDYDKGLISKGGGVYARSLKSIPLGAEFRAFLGTEEKSMAPIDLLHAILKSEADLLWIGGIGTYVKATSESNSEVGDRANDALRVSGDELNVKVVGEGGNLGMTQRGRIEFARNGGMLNTDFIDNSAGVDCSDKEVNIKILVAGAMESGALDPKDRVRLLSSMTKEVGHIVLEDNYLQTQAISIAEARAKRDIEQHENLIKVLEREERLDRAIEFLPSDEQFVEMAVNQEGLTRPEISVVTSYAKMSLFDLLVQSPIVDSPILQPELEWGFPRKLSERFPQEMRAHRLEREIIATTLANQVINRAGLTFVLNAKEETGLAVDQIVSAYLVVRETFNLAPTWEAIDRLDYKTPWEVQMAMHEVVVDFVQHQAVWFLRNMPRPLNVEGLIKRYSKGIEALFARPEAVLSPIAGEVFAANVTAYRDAGVPLDLARYVAGMEVMKIACDLVNVADSLKRKVADVGVAYFDVGHRIGFDWLRQKGEDLISDDHWDSLAISSIADDYANMQRELTRTILSQANGSNGCSAVAKWMNANVVVELRAERLIGDLKASGPMSIAKLGFAARHIKSIMPS